MAKCQLLQVAQGSLVVVRTVADGLPLTQFQEDGDRRLSNELTLKNIPKELSVHRKASSRFGLPNLYYTYVYRRFQSKIIQKITAKAGL